MRFKKKKILPIMPKNKHKKTDMGKRKKVDLTNLSLQEISDTPEINFQENVKATDVAFKGQTTNHPKKNKKSIVFENNANCFVENRTGVITENSTNLRVESSNDVCIQNKISPLAEKNTDSQIQDRTKMNFEETCTFTKKPKTNSTTNSTSMDKEMQEIISLSYEYVNTQKPEVLKKLNFFIHGYISQTISIESSIKTSNSEKNTQDLANTPPSNPIDKSSLSCLPPHIPSQYQFNNNPYVMVSLMFPTLRQHILDLESYIRFFEIGGYENEHYSCKYISMYLIKYLEYVLFYKLVSDYINSDLKSDELLLRNYVSFLKTSHYSFLPTKQQVPLNTDENNNSSVSGDNFESLPKSRYRILRKLIPIIYKLIYHNCRFNLQPLMQEFFIFEIGATNILPDQHFAFVSFLFEFTSSNMDVDEKQLLNILQATYISLYTHNGFEIPITGALVLFLLSNNVVGLLSNSREVCTLASKVIIFLVSKFSLCDKPAISTLLSYPLLLALKSLQVDSIQSSNNINNLLLYKTITALLDHKNSTLSNYASQSFTSNNQSSPHAPPEDLPLPIFQNSFASCVSLFLHTYLCSFREKSRLPFLSISSSGHGSISHFFVILCISLSSEFDITELTFLKKASLALYCPCPVCLKLRQFNVEDLFITHLCDLMSPSCKYKLDISEIVKSVIPNTLQYTPRTFVNIYHKYEKLLKTLWLEISSSFSEKDRFMCISKQFLETLGSFYCTYTNFEPTLLIQIISEYKNQYVQSDEVIFRKKTIAPNGEKLLVEILDTIKFMERKNPLYSNFECLIQEVLFFINDVNISKALIIKCISTLICVSRPSTFHYIWVRGLSLYFKTNHMELDKDILCLLMNFYKKSISFLYYKFYTNNNKHHEIKSNLNAIFKELNQLSNISLDTYKSFCNELIAVSYFHSILASAPDILIKKYVEFTDNSESLATYRLILPKAFRQAYEKNSCNVPGTSDNSLVKKYINSCLHSPEDIIDNFKNNINLPIVDTSLNNYSSLDLILFTDIISKSSLFTKFDLHTKASPLFMFTDDSKQKWWTSQYFLIIEYFSALKDLCKIDKLKRPFNSKIRNSDTLHESSNSHVAQESIISNVHSLILNMISKKDCYETYSKAHLLNMANFIIYYSAAIVTNVDDLEESKIESTVVSSIELLNKVNNVVCTRKNDRNFLILFNAITMCLAFILQSARKSHENCTKHILKIYSSIFDYIFREPGVNFNYNDSLICLNYIGLGASLILTTLLKFKCESSLTTKTVILMSNIYKAIRHYKNDCLQLEGTEVKQNGVIVGLAMISCAMRNTDLRDSPTTASIRSDLAEKLGNEIVKDLYLPLHNDDLFSERIDYMIDNPTQSLISDVSILLLMNSENFLSESLNLSFRNEFKLKRIFSNLDNYLSISPGLDETMFIFSCIIPRFVDCKGKIFDLAKANQTESITYWKIFAATMSINESEANYYINNTTIEEFRNEKKQLIQLDNFKNTTKQHLDIVVWKNYVKCRILQKKLIESVYAKLEGVSHKIDTKGIIKVAAKLMNFIESQKKNGDFVNEVILLIINAVLRYEEDPVKYSKMLHIYLYSFNSVNKNYISKIMPELIQIVSLRIQVEKNKQPDMLLARSLLYIAMVSWTYYNPKITKLFLKILNTFIDYLNDKEFADGTFRDFSKPQFYEINHKIPDTINFELWMDHTNQKFLLELITSSEGLIKSTIEILKLLNIDTSNNSKSRSSNFNSESRYKNFPPLHDNFNTKRDTLEAQIEKIQIILKLMECMFLYVINSKNTQYILSAMSCIRPDFKFTTSLVIYLRSNFLKDNMCNLLENFSIKIWDAFVSNNHECIIDVPFIKAMMYLLSFNFIIIPSQSPTIIEKYLIDNDGKSDYKYKICVIWCFKNILNLSGIKKEISKEAEKRLCTMMDRFSVENDIDCMFSSALIELNKNEFIEMYTFLFNVWNSVSSASFGVVTFLNIIPTLLNMRQGACTARLILLKVIPLLMSNIDPISFNLYSESLNETILYQDMLTYLHLHLLDKKISFKSMHRIIKSIFDYIYKLNTNTENTKEDFFMSLDEAIQLKNSILKLSTLKEQDLESYELYDLISIE